MITTVEKPNYHQNSLFTIMRSPCLSPEFFVYNPHNHQIHCLL